MSNINNETLTEALFEALETMAFLTVLPVEEPPAPPSDAFQGRIEFSGLTRGTVEILAGRSFGTLLASNVMGTDPEDEETIQKAEDALKELLNITCGALIPKMSNSSADVFDVTIPQLNPLDGPGAWEQLTTKENFTVLDVEDNPVAVRIQLKTDNA